MAQKMLPQFMEDILRVSISDVGGLNSLYYQYIKTKQPLKI